jgi:hypothetical protein
VFTGHSGERLQPLRTTWWWAQTLRTTCREDVRCARWSAWCVSHPHVSACMRKMERDSLAPCCLLQAGDSEYNACLDNIKELHRYGSSTARHACARACKRAARPRGRLEVGLYQVLGPASRLHRRLPLPPCRVYGHGVEAGVGWSNRLADSLQSIGTQLLKSNGNNQSLIRRAEDETENGRVLSQVCRCDA